MEWQKYDRNAPELNQFVGEYVSVYTHSNAANGMVVDADVWQGPEMGFEFWGDKVAYWLPAPKAPNLEELEENEMLRPAKSMSSIEDDDRLDRMQRLLVDLWRSGGIDKGLALKIHNVYIQEKRRLKSGK